ncbi:unnamed protein product [Clonostachys rosea f. rosea IK726]|jgi:hypothetical protein|uniref:Uncharacterized protein n=1 Tax=Clonostachys rosea f. rosea IK726 TaxID=1349383 RepID=A0ACA9TZK9_BIOOC|nr:unnamed protein product [Clonostachys rosea f. rosea IK726]
MDDQFLQLSPEMGQEFLQTCVDLGLFQGEPALTMDFPPPLAGLDSLQAEGIMVMQAKHAELFEAYAKNKQSQENLIKDLTQFHGRASAALAEKTAATKTMKELLDEQSALDPQCFAMRHAEALNELQITTECEASLSRLVETGHRDLKKVTQEGGDIVFQLKVLEMQLQKADPSFQLYDYGKVGPEVEDEMMA